MEHEHAASLTARAVKKALPDRAILTKEARHTINSAASVFTLYLTSIAQDISVARKRSTITLDDVLQALRDADFDHFIDPIESCVQETKAAASRKKHMRATTAIENESEVTNEVTEQLDEVAIQSNEENIDGDEDMISADEEVNLEECDSGKMKKSELIDDTQDAGTCQAPN
ncbi:hypothetical protein PsorP6_000384 [Peronosclerospora sorghi]|uniref:Uncharacterized protein n=1 Tax=Peronosclerospora sorghi TaxID=230839 RepID=A0ACC0WQC6_9STRA|nr:hypothetical protein PsorP6_000384 [Peronosclerospora sorghi]